MTKRILYIVGEYPSRTETFIEREIAGLSRLGLSIDVHPLGAIDWSKAALALSRRIGVAQKIWRDLGAETSRKRRLSALLRAAYIAENAKDAEHIHAHFLGLPSTTGFCLSRMLGIPYSLTAHARDIYAENTPKIVIEQALFRTTCTETNRRCLNARGPEFQLIRHGLTFPIAAPRELRTSSPCRILAIGRFVEKKGFTHLIRACAELRRRNFPFELTIVGEGPLYEESAREIRLLDIENDAKIPGALPHEAVLALYHEADVFVAPSIMAADGDRDGVPNVLLEAMAAGVPIISTDAGSIPEIVQNGETGIITPQGNAHALAGAIEDLWKNTDVRTRMTEIARREIAREFDEARWLGALFALFIGVDA